MENWVPQIFEDVKNYSPIEGENIFVSELTTHELINGIKSTRDYQSLLIDSNLIEFIKPNEIIQTTNNSVHPIFDKDYEYKGRSSVFVSNTKGLKKVKPFIFSWESANNISFLPDPYFLLTYGLTPRTTEDQIYWDDLSRPKINIVTCIPKSIYDFPIYSKSFVKINKEYLQDYLMLTKKTLIQVYWETRILPPNYELNKLLGENNFFEKTTKYNHFRFNKISDNQIFTEVTGFRVLQLDDSVPISNEHRKVTGHIWPGYDEKINLFNAKHWNYVYVSDEVLGKYEQDKHYSVCPETGGVSYKNQWSVTRCSRVGRNYIKIELFKLYEGTPHEVISYWNNFAVDKSRIDENQRNIAERSKKLVFSYLRFGELLSSLINRHYDLNLSSQDLIKINRQELNYHAWYNNESIEPITYHLDHNLSKQDFLIRQKQLQLFLTENLVERNLRNIATVILKIDLDKFKKTPVEVFRSIKILNLILNYISISQEAGLNLKIDSPEINSRLENELKEIELINLLKAINTLRQLDSHQQGSKSKLSEALSVFGINGNECSGNYLNACEIIYDKLFIVFERTSQILY